MIHILPAEVTDAAEILALQRLAYQSEAELYQDFGIPPLRQTQAEMEDDCRTQTVLKAVDGDAIAGSVRAYAAGGVCNIGRLVVHPDRQRQGIGTALMARIEALFPQVERYELFTGARSEGNLRLYRRLGYVPTETRVLSERVTLVFLSKPAA